MQKTKKSVIALCLTLIMALSLVGTASAVTLKNSFSGGSSYEFIGKSRYSTAVNTMNDYRKTTWAKTVGYQPKHYVRAYIGGSKTSAANALSDSGRVVGYGDIIAKARYTLPVNQGQPAAAVFPTGYAWYGD